MTIEQLGDALALGTAPFALIAAAWAAFVFRRGYRVRARTTILRTLALTLLMQRDRALSVLDRVSATDMMLWSIFWRFAIYIVSLPALGVVIGITEFDWRDEGGWSVLKGWATFAMNVGVTLAAGGHVLAYWRQVPEDHRRQWGPLTMAWYPDDRAMLVRLLSRFSRD